MQTLRFLLCALAALAASSLLSAQKLNHDSHPARDADPDVDGTMPEDYLPALKQLLETAAHESPQLIADALDVDVANAAKLYNGIAPLLPNFNGSLQYGTTVNQVADNPAANSRNSGLQYSVYGNQSVFHWGQLKDRLDQSRIVVAINQRQYANAYQLFAASLRRQYLALIQMKITVRNTRFNLEGAERNLAFTRERQKHGAATATDEQGARLAEADARLASDQLDEQYDFARRQFGRLLGRPDFADAEVPLEVPEPRFSSPKAAELLADVLRTGARYTGDSQVALLQIRQAKLDYQYWKVNLLPQINLQADIQQRNQTNATPTSVSQTAVTQEEAFIRADWNIFDGLASHGRAREAVLRRRQAERRLKINADEAMAQAQHAERAVEFAWRGLRTAEERASTAVGNLKFNEEERKHGHGSEESVAAARANLYAWQSSVAANRAAYMMAWSDFVGLTGHDPALNSLPASYVRPVQ